MADATDHITASQADGRDSERVTRNGEGGDDKDGRTADVSGWRDHTPSGLRGPIDEAEAAELASRDRQTQHVTQQDRLLRHFSHAQFVAHLGEKVSYTRNGDMVFTIQVPYQFKHLAIPLTDAFGIPLSFDVEVWRPYSNATGGNT